MWDREEAPMNIKIVLGTEGWVSIVVAPLYCERQKDTILLGKSLNLVESKVMISGFKTIYSQLS